MRIVLHIGPEAAPAERLQEVLDAKRAQLAGKGVLYARAPGARNHTRLYMAVTDPDRPDALRLARGFGPAGKQEVLRHDLARSLAGEVRRHKPDLLILSAHQLGSQLTRRAELERLHALLAPLSGDITVLAHVDDPARMLLRRYAAQVLEGRASDLSAEMALLDAPDWWEAALAMTRPLCPGAFPEAQTPVHWLDLPRLVAEWDSVFGPGRVTLRRYDPALWAAETVTDEIRAAFGIEDTIGKADPWQPPAMPPARWLARCVAFNEALLRLSARRGQAVPRVLWRRLLGELGIAGPAEAPGSLHRISARFAPALAGLGTLPADPPQPDWTPPDPGNGFRATQYLAAFLPRIEAAQREEAAQPRAEDTDPGSVDEVLSPHARRLLPELAKQKFLSLQGGPFAPHNRLGQLDETAEAPPYTPAPPRALPPGSTGRVIVACMKTEAPYILEWIAYHRAIGIDSFVVYTNGCEDTTDPLLKRLETLGYLHHRNNEGWKGNSPQQHALNLAMKDPVVTASDWIAHIDVDEFINIRCGNGTLDDFLALVPEATNVAMTWRLFGHGGVTAFTDTPVIAQFDTCAPRHCPKPHTTWGFKTLTRNTGAYAKLSCHRPTQLREGAQVTWVNGNGQDMTREVARNGWRNTKRSIGYDLLQLNHYALRSAESFLIKRQRGRALHVDRSIGLNYWVRHDWTGARDITIRRNLPRMLAELARLKADPELARLHAEGVAWHKAKAAELRATPEFAELYAQAIALRLTETERVAFALALDVES